MTTSITHNETAPVLVDVASIPRLGLFRLSGQLAVFLVTLVATQQGAGSAINVDDDTATPINTVAGTIVESLDGDLTVNDPAPALVAGTVPDCLTDPVKLAKDDAQDTLQVTGLLPDGTTPPIPVAPDPTATPDPAIVTTPAVVTPSPAPTVAVDVVPATPPAPVDVVASPANAVPSVPADSSTSTTTPAAT